MAGDYLLLHLDETRVRRCPRCVCVLEEKNRVLLRPISKLHLVHLALIFGGDYFPEDRERGRRVEEAGGTVVRV